MMHPSPRPRSRAREEDPIGTISSSHANPRPSAAAPDILAVVALGGMAGAVCRYGVGGLITASPGGVPWDTFVENVTGAFLLGVVLTALVRRYPGSRYLRPFLAVGFLGSFTTFSALAVEADQLIRDGQVVLAGGYWTLSLVAGVTAAFVGIAVTRTVLRSAAEHDR